MGQIRLLFGILVILSCGMFGCQEVDNPLSATSRQDRSTPSAYLSPAGDEEGGQEPVFKPNGVDLVSYLDLTDEQVEKLMAILHEVEERRHEVEGRKAISFSTSKEEQLLEILTEEQRKKYEELLESGRGFRITTQDWGIFWGCIR